ncbi:DUF2793 domain-containing protein [Pararhodobacter marinus]|uniref:DUF2793 domain-containing protein n=1 Tax=Pararhodobacter marinus TaxID=2184063 RepID=UPI003510D43A
MDETSPNLSLPYLQASQAQKHVTHNAALEALDLIVQLVLQSFSQTTPPLAPDEGQVWAVGNGAVNDWVGHDGELAAWSNGGWLFITPRPGWRGAMGSDLRVWSGTAWIATDLPPLQNLPGLGINTSYDATNRLSVRAASTLLDNAGAGHRLVVNKDSGSDTAALLFQTGYSGRAEMGTTGSDDFAVKVSPDGSGWTTALEIDAATGNTAMGALSLGAPLAPGSGGTGVANPAGATLTRNGAHALNLTTIAPSALTLPTTGTLATQAGAETLSNKTLAAPAITGLASGSAITQSATDATAGRLLKVGDTRLSPGDGSPENTDLDTIEGLGFWTIGASAANSPGFIGGAGALISFQRSNTRKAQIASNGGLGNRWGVRTQDDSGTWHPWAQLVHSRNLVGPVGQSAGIPTGAVLERGANANGSYVRLADGTQICWHAIDDTATAWGTAESGLFRRASPATWTYAALFSIPPCVTATAHIGNDWIAGCRPRGVPATNAVLLMPWSSSAPGTSTAKTIFACAIGRWF